MVEGEHRGSLRRAAQIIKIGMRTEYDIGGDLSRRLIGRVCQHPQCLTQRDRRLMGHPGQLTTTDHGDDGSFGHRHMLSCWPHGPAGTVRLSRRQRPESDDHVHARTHMRSADRFALPCHLP